MARVKRGKISLAIISEDDIALLARYGDKESFDYLWQLAIPQVGRIAGAFCRRYPWIDHDDLTQTMLLEFPKLVARFRPHVARAKRITWNKYLYFSLYRTGQDALRREDPLGVSIPQKSPYPSWRRFSEITDSNNLTEQIVTDGLAKIDRGDSAVLDASANQAENNTDVTSHDRKPTADYHDLLYHGSLPKWERDVLP